MSSSKENYPVVVISHGWTGFRNLYTDAAEALASNGLIVFSIDHTYGSSAVVFNDRTVAALNRKALPDRNTVPNFLEYANTLVNTYSGDIDLVLSYLTALNSGNVKGSFENKLDLASIGLLGHSTGGGAAVTTALNNKAVKALMGLDAWVEPITLDNIYKGLKMPSLFLRSQQRENGFNNSNLFKLLERNNSPTELYQLKGVNHLDFTMAYMYSPLSRIFKFTGELDGRKGAEIQQDLILNFFNKHLKNSERISVESTAAKYSEVSKILSK